MGRVVAGAAVTPADQRWGFWPLLPAHHLGEQRFQPPDFCMVSQASMAFLARYSLSA